MFLAFSLLAERRQFFQPVLLLRTEGILAHLFFSVKHSTKPFCIHLNMFFKTVVYSCALLSRWSAFCKVCCLDRRPAISATQRAAAPSVQTVN